MGKGGGTRPWHRASPASVGLLISLVAGSACGVPSSKAVKATGGFRPQAVTVTSAGNAASTTTMTGTVSTGSLKDKLLSVSDVPAGWIVEATPPSPGNTGPVCAGGDPSRGPFKLLPEQVQVNLGPRPTAASLFGGATEQLARGTDSGASRAYSQIVSALGPCLDRPFRNPQTGEVMLIERTALEVPVNEGAAYRVTLASSMPSASAPPDSSTSLVVDVLFARKGNIVMVLSYGPHTKGDAALAALAAKALAML